MKFKKWKFEKALSTFIAEYINYLLAKIEVLEKTDFSPLGLKICRSTKKHMNNKWLQKHSLHLLFDMFSWEINSNKEYIRIKLVTKYGWMLILGK